MPKNRNEDRLRQCTLCGACPSCNRLIDKKDDSVYPMTDTGFRVKNPPPPPIKFPVLPATDRRLLAGFLPLFFHDSAQSVEHQDQLDHADMLRTIWFNHNPGKSLGDFKRARV